MTPMYKKIKKQNGEAFAQGLRNYHNGLLEIPDIDQIVRHAGRDATPLLPYLMSLLASNDDVSEPPPVPQDPFVLLAQAGYDAFYADSLDKQNSIKKYFQPGELLCTFNDAARHKDFHIVHAVRKDVAQIRREDFKGKEQRQDEYGTSVISIQMLKTGGFISIKNRYNHAVVGCDNTFNSNPDNIIYGLSAALKARFNVEFSASKNALPDGFVLMNDRVFKYHTERRNIYYGDQAWAQNGVIHDVNKAAGDALFEWFLFDNKTKMLRKIDNEVKDSFAEDFNRDYGGNPGLYVKDGHLMLGDDVLIGAEHSRIKTLCLPALTTMGDHCLYDIPTLTSFKADALMTMGSFCLESARALTSFESPALTMMGNDCLRNSNALTSFKANALTTMGNGCLCDVEALKSFEADALTTMGDYCLSYTRALTSFEAPRLAVLPQHLKKYSTRKSGTSLKSPRPAPL